MSDAETELDVGVEDYLRVAGCRVGLVVDELVLQGLGEQVRCEVLDGVTVGVRVAELLDQVQHVGVGSEAVGVQKPVESSAAAGCLRRVRSAG